MSNADNFPASNTKYISSFGDKGSLPLPPGKKLTIVTCMDARIDPAASLGIHEGDAHIIRNAGGRAKDALRSVIISQQLLGTREVALFHHTDCGMLTFTNNDIHGVLHKSFGPEGGKEGEAIDFLPFPELEQSVKDDVEFLENNKLVLGKESGVKITGWIYDVKTGKVNQIV